MPVMSFIDAVNLAMKEEMERDEKVFILGEDVDVKGAFLKRQQDFTSNLVNTAY